MDVFRLRDRVIHDYAEYVRSFVQIREPRLRDFVEQSLRDEALWPQPLIQRSGAEKRSPHPAFGLNARRGLSSQTIYYEVIDDSDIFSPDNDPRNGLGSPV